MKRTLLFLAAGLSVAIGYTTPADACGVKLTVKAPKVKKQVKRSDNPSQVLLLGNPPRKLALSLSQAGHNVEVAESPDDAKRKRYNVVVADREQVDQAESSFPDSRVVARSGSTRANLRDIELALAEPPTRSRDRRVVAARTDAPKRQARESTPRPRRAPTPTEVAQRETPPAQRETTGVAINTNVTPKATEEVAVTTRQEPERPTARVPEEREATGRQARFTEELFFGSNSVRLNKRNMGFLADNARWLKQNPEASITIEGHADASGAPEYNLDLGERRAKAVAEYLISRGVDASRIETVSRGEEQPKYGENNPKNRRVVIVKQ